MSTCGGVLSTKMTIEMFGCTVGTTGRQIHVYVIHTDEINTYVIYAYEVHAYEMQMTPIRYTPMRYTPMEVFYEDPALWNTVAYLF